MQPKSSTNVLPPKGRNWFTRHKIITAVLAIFVLLLAIGALQGNPLKSELKKMDIEHILGASQICTSSQGPNENDFSYEAYSGWYDAPDTAATVASIESAAKKAGYTTKFTQTNNQDVPKDAQSAMPDYELDGTNKTNGNKLQISAWRGITQISCGGGLARSPGIRTYTPKSGRIALLVLFSKG